MANHSKAINESTLISLMDDLEALSKAAKSAKEKLVKLLPAKYGSDLWWDKQTKENISQYKDGEFRSFSTVKELMKDLNS